MKIFGCWICFNNINTIKESISSVLQYVDELVVVDGSFTGETSTDGTWEVVEEFGKVKPLHHIKSIANTLFNKHNEHVAITGNKNKDVYTWQVDADEVYMPDKAAEVYNAIKSNKFNGIGVKLLTSHTMDKQGNIWCDKDVYECTADTTQMRVYRMINGLHFETKDGIFEHIVYEDGKPVQRQDNMIGYDNFRFQVFNYHCFDSYEKIVKRLTHYRSTDPEGEAKKLIENEKNGIAIKDHPLRIKK
jgi:glycosyltransferase involved in cell wall biosynthesis